MVRYLYLLSVLAYHAEMENNCLVLPITRPKVAYLESRRPNFLPCIRHLRAQNQRLLISMLHILFSAAFSSLLLFGCSWALQASSVSKWVLTNRPFPYHAVDRHLWHLKGSPWLREHLHDRKSNQLLLLESMGAHTSSRQTLGLLDVASVEVDPD